MTTKSDISTNQIDLFKKIAKTKSIDQFIDYTTKNNIHIFLPNDYFFTAFHSLLQGFRHADFM